jgi:Ribbon-helix-helix protein, copG family.
MKTNTTSVGVRVTDNELQTINEEIERGNAVNTSDFIRQAIREKIQKVKLEA